MSAIITDQLRISNAKNFVEKVTSGDDSLYCFVGLPNSSEYDENWNLNPPSPKDNFDEENDYWDSIFAIKKITSEEIRLSIRKTMWASGTTYDMYRHDISRNNLSKPSNSTSLYSSNFYVINKDYKVYICLQNGTNPENPLGRPSLNEPTFVDVEPRSAGTSGDGYIWKYLYTIKPSDIIKYDSTNYISVPLNWETTNDPDISYVRDNADYDISGQIKIVVIKNRGSNVGPPNSVYTDVPISGDGEGAKATVIVGNNSKVESVIVTTGGKNYTYATLDLKAGGVPTGELVTSSPSFDVIIPPQGGHGFNIYRELGTFNVLIYSRIDNDLENPDFILGNEISRIGLILNPRSYDSNTVLTENKYSSLSALKLVGTNNINDYRSAIFSPDSYITQQVGSGITAIGRVVSYNQETGVLKYWQDRSLFGFNLDKTQNINSQYGYSKINFTDSPQTGGSLNILGTNNNIAVKIDNAFSGISTTINSKKYNLGQIFVKGISNPEVKPQSGDIVYVDNRPSILRSINQKEDIKVILQF